MFDIKRFEKECIINDFAAFIVNSDTPIMREIRSRMGVYPRPTTEVIYDQSILCSFRDKILHQMFDILLQDDECDNFWLSPTNGDLRYYDSKEWKNKNEIPFQTIKINKQGLKSFLRDYKLNQIVKD